MPSIEPISKDFPAKFSRRVLDEIIGVLATRPDVRTIFDPFAGVGGVHELRAHGYATFGIEIEREWARTSAYTFVGNALDPRAVKTIAKQAPFDAIVTSPSYGNRMADHHHARDACGECDGCGVSASSFGERIPCPRCNSTGLSRRNTYAHRLRAAAQDQTRELHAENSGGMQWGDEYRDLHRRVWRKTVALLRAEGLFVLNTSDHKRDEVRQKVNGFHVGVLQSLGLVVEDISPVVTQRNRNGANAAVRVDAELVTVLRKPRRQR